ncbi:MAG TPA: potassium channel family protein, partial [Patescibacteria group bacterium]|nr:potassium channel family protein [Patescibacteria group bacterium]
MNPLRRLIIPGLILLIIVTFATLGYQYLEGWSFIDSLYMVVITLSTLGFREVHDLNTAGRLMTIVVIIFGIATVGYTVGQLIEMMVEGQIIGYRRKKQMKQRISEL